MRLLACRFWTYLMVICCRILIGCALLATIANTLRVYPHQLAYFNEAAGGPENGYRHLLGSNVDWGQDLYYLQEWLAARSSARATSIITQVRYDPTDIGVGQPLEGAPSVSHSSLIAITVNESTAAPEWFDTHFGASHAAPILRTSGATQRPRKPVYMINGTMSVFNVTGSTVR